MMSSLAPSVLKDAQGPAVHLRPGSEPLFFSKSVREVRAGPKGPSLQ